MRPDPMYDADPLTLFTRPDSWDSVNGCWKPVLVVHEVWEYHPDVAGSITLYRHVCGGQYKIIAFRCYERASKSTPFSLLIDELKQEFSSCETALATLQA